MDIWSSYFWKHDACCVLFCNDLHTLPQRLFRPSWWSDAGKGRCVQGDERLKSELCWPETFISASLQLHPLLVYRCQNAILMFLSDHSSRQEVLRSLIWSCEERDRTPQDQQPIIVYKWVIWGLAETFKFQAKLLQSTSFLHYPPFCPNQ